MTNATAVVVIVVAGLALGALCFVAVILTNTVVRLVRFSLARNPIEAARAEQIVKGDKRPTIDPLINPAELP